MPKPSKRVLGAYVAPPKNLLKANGDLAAGPAVCTANEMASSMKRVIVWFRGDLRIHDHPALYAASKSKYTILPLFVLDPTFLKQTIGSNRNRFLLESLKDLQCSLRAIGGDLVLQQGTPEKVLLEIATTWHADAVYYVSDFSPYSIARDKAVQKALQKKSIEFIGYGGKLVVDGSTKLRTKSGKFFTVFTPFWKAWMEIRRRDVMPPPTQLICDLSVPSDDLPKLEDITSKDDLSPHPMPGGETAGRIRLTEFIAKHVDSYHQDPTDMARPQTSFLSPYLHFGCISAREAESMLPDSRGARAWNRQLAWRDFYHYILLYFPASRNESFQERYQKIAWDNNPDYIAAWKNGATGYPVVDAGMRELRETGFMHNRARMIVGSFLTKHLWTDWRIGEEYFMRMLLDGDTANNVGNWQWIAGTGVDPAPFYRRLYNPTLQAKRLDPTGGYIRMHVPELKNVPDEYIYEPWTMPEAMQQKVGCVIGKEYPAPIVDHKTARAYALEKNREALNAFEQQSHD